MIDRHDMLRAVIDENGRQQILEHTPPYEIEITKLEGEPLAIVESRLQAIRKRMSHQVLNPSTWPMFEISASKIDARQIRIHLSFDMLIADAPGILLMMREVSQFYRNPEEMPVPLELSFRDYVLAEAAFQKSDLYQRSR